MKSFDGINYYNCGDWVDSCTALVEHLDGRMELVRSVPELKLAPVKSIAPEPAIASRDIQPQTEMRIRAGKL
jgi:hypothetical protein